jgi:hypothetical protein
LRFNENGSVTFKLNGLCTKVTTVATYRTTTQPPVNDALTFDLEKLLPAAPITTVSTPVATGQALTVSSGTVGTKYLRLTLSSISSGDFSAALGDSKVYCNVSALPEFVNSDI